MKNYFDKRFALAMVFAIVLTCVFGATYSSLMVNDANECNQAITHLQQVKIGNNLYLQANGIVEYSAGYGVHIAGTQVKDGNFHGNSDTVTDGVYTSGSYSDPSWLSISKAKVGLSAILNALQLYKDGSDFAGLTQGALFYHNGASWDYLPAGTSGRYLKTQGAGANPTWDNPYSLKGITKTIGVTGSGADYECDGTADNEQFVAAIAAATNGDTIYIFPGTYTFADQVHSTKKLKFSGAGYSVTKITNNGIAALRLEVAESVVEDINFDSLSAWDGGSLHTDIHKCIVRRCWFTNQTAGSRGLEIANNDILVEDCIFGDNASGTPSICISTSDNLARATIRRCHFLYVGTGILIQRNAQNSFLVIENNYIKAISYGIRHYPPDGFGSAAIGVKIIHNHILCGSYGIYVDNLGSVSPTQPSNWIIAINDFEGAGYFSAAPIYLKGLKDSIIACNSFGDTAEAATALVLLGTSSAGSFHCTNNLIMCNSGNASECDYAVKEESANQDYNQLLGNSFVAGEIGTVLLAGANSENIIKATGAEIDTGTDNVKYATAKAIADSRTAKGIAAGLSSQYMLALYNDALGKALLQSQIYSDATGNINIPTGAEYRVNGAKYLSGDAIPAILDGNGFALVAGSYVDIPVKYACTITSYQIFNNTRTDATDAVSLDLRRCTYSQYDSGATHPVVGDSIVASAPVIISAGASNYKNTDSTLTGWTKTLAAGDVIRIYVNSCVNMPKVSLIINVTR